jgi:hypothetical protein
MLNWVPHPWPTYTPVRGERDFALCIENRPAPGASRQGNIELGTPPVAKRVARIAYDLSAAFLIFIDSFKKDLLLFTRHSSLSTRHYMRLILAAHVGTPAWSALYFSYGWKQHNRSLPAMRGKEPHPGD